MAGAIAFECAVCVTAGVFSGYVSGHVCEKIGKTVGKMLGDSVAGKNAESKADIWGSRIAQGLITSFGPIGAHALFNNINLIFQLKNLVAKYNLPTVELFMALYENDLKERLLFEAFVVAFSLAVIVRGIYMETYRTHANREEKIQYGIGGIAATLGGGALSLVALDLLARTTGKSKAPIVLACVLCGALSYSLGAYIASMHPTKKA